MHPSSRYKDALQQQETTENILNARSTEGRGGKDLGLRGRAEDVREHG